MTHKNLLRGAAVGAAFALSATIAGADSISPTTYSNDSLGVGDSVTISKTVVIEAGGPSDALIDVMFIFDTTGSMGAALATAQTAAADILTGISGFGDLASGVGFYNDPAFDGVLQDLSTNDATTIGNFSFGASGGGDFPEKGNSAIEDAANNASWRPGSNRFIVALGDSSFLDIPPGGPTDEDVQTALADNDVELIGLRFQNFDFGSSRSNDDNFIESIESLGGTALSGSTDPDDLVEIITDGISGSFDTYTEVTVDDLDAGLPEIDVSVVCTGADSGVCDGATAIGDYDRTSDRTFTFDVTFTRVADGDTTFTTNALVDGGIVAREIDTFTGGGSGGGGGTPVIPLPAGVWLLLGGLGTLGAMRRRKTA
ncbi:MAG: VPLPA-CTERM sorting domain-containing protein [Pseudomonadota bacterium]